MRRSIFALVALVLTACGGGSPTTPQGPQYPTVAGSYSGSMTFTYPELRQTITCPGTTSVTQNGANVSIAPIVLSGSCAGISIPFGSTTIDVNGALSTISNQTYYDASCGGNYTASASGGFFGRKFQASIIATSNVCWNMNITADLTR